MNLSEEDLNTSDAWLSEQLFAQLKDLNSEYADKNSTTDFLLNENFHNCAGNMPLLDDVVPWQDLKPNSLDTFDSALKVDDFHSNYDINEVLDLSQTHSREHQLQPEQTEENLFDLVENIPLISVPDVSNLNEGTEKILSSIYDPTEEELQILKFLETQPNEELKKPTLHSPEIITFSETSEKGECIKGNFIFNSGDFQSHDCKKIVDKVATRAQTTKVVTSFKPVINDTPLPIEPACIRLLKENQIRIRRFLKDELKYDVNSNSNTVNSSNASTLNGVPHSSNTSNASINNKKQDGPHECTLCERKFVHASGLLRHMEKHALDLIPTPNTVSNKSATSHAVHGVSGLRVVIKCTLCGRIFFDCNESLKHLFAHFPDSIAEENEMDNCPIIPYDAYIDDAYKTLKAECEFCDFVFSEVSYLFVHSACHLPSRRFECFACDIHVKTSKEIYSHWHAECVFMRENLKVHQATTQRYFVCNVCENKFQTMDLLHEHRYTSYHFFPRLDKRTGKLQLPCEYCENIFETAQDCVNHYEDKHYKKNKRDKVGSSASSKTRQYLCDICGKSYTQSSHLWQHLRFHQGVKPFACKEPGCTRKFTIRPDLNDHIRKCHTGERPYHCQVCGKRFLTGSVFYQHRLIHRGERRYECEACGKRFYRADALKNHQRIHTGEKPFGCHFCTKNFRQRGDRDKHIRARHSHLDANARLMMQMQKLQLEAAASQSEDAQKIVLGNKNVAIPQFELKEDPYARNNCSDILMMSNLEFSKNVLESLISDMIN